MPDLETTEPATLDVTAIRAQFPILSRKVRGHPLVYLDNAATTQRPAAVIDAVSDFFRTSNANVHRGVHTLSQEATAAFERARDLVARRLNARESREVVFTRGTTEAINLVASSWGGEHLRPGDEVLITHMEHHSNIVPWQLACSRTGAVLRVAPVDDRGRLDLAGLDALLSARTRIVALVHVSNTLGTVNPVAQIAEMARARGAVVLVDGAQAMAHIPVDVEALGCDFYAFSGHKVFAPTGIGALWGRAELLEAMPPYQGGGEMIKSVTFEETIYNDLPAKFEAGTPDIGGAVGLGAAMEFLGSLDPAALAAHESALAARAAEALSAVPGVRLIGTAEGKVPVVAFTLEGVHPHDIGTILDHAGIAVRTGHHCTQPLMERFGVTATARASFCVYNTLEEIDVLVEGLERVRKVFG